MSIQSWIGKGHLCVHPNSISRIQQKSWTLSIHSVMDCRLMAFETVTEATRLWIKGCDFYSRPSAWWCLHGRNGEIHRQTAVHFPTRTPRLPPLPFDSGRYDMLHDIHFWRVLHGECKVISFCSVRLFFVDVLLLFKPQATHTLSPHSRTWLISGFFPNAASMQSALLAPAFSLRIHTQLSRTSNTYRSSFRTESIPLYSFI